jgi:hypothetical protein
MRNGNFSVFEYEKICHNLQVLTRLCVYLSGLLNTIFPEKPIGRKGGKSPANFPAGFIFIPDLLL